MFSKTKMILAAALMVGVVSAAQAGGRDDADPNGGYRIGPTGQSFDGGATPVFRPSLSGSSANALVDQIQPSRSHKKPNSR